MYKISHIRLFCSRKPVRRIPLCFLLGPSELVNTVSIKVEGEVELDGPQQQLDRVRPREAEPAESADADRMAEITGGEGGDPL